MAVQVIASSYTDGPTLTAAAAASCLPTYVPTTLPAGYWQIGRIWRVYWCGRISSVITTPGTARFDIRLGGVVAFDSGAISLDTAARTTVPFEYEAIMTCRAVGSGTSANLIGWGHWHAIDHLNEHGHGNSVNYPSGTPAVGTGFNSASALTLDSFFTQTVATGSMTLHQFLIEQLTP
jgi:hypothetical protein